MKISGITEYQVNLPVRDGGFRQSSGRVWRTLDSTIVRIDTDDGVSGWGEACPFGPNYVPAFAGGVRASLELLGPALIGVDPCGLLAVNQVMDKALYGPRLRQDRTRHRLLGHRCPFGGAAPVRPAGRSPHGAKQSGRILFP